MLLFLCNSYKIFHTKYYLIQLCTKKDMKAKIINGSKKIQLKLERTINQNMELICTLKNKLKHSKSINYLFCVFFAITSCGNNKELSMQKKIADFDSLYVTLKENYMYFDVNKRVNKINWLANYESYKDRIKKTRNDAEFYHELNNILNDLNNGHTDLSFNNGYDSYLSLFEKYGEYYRPYINEMKKNNADKKNKKWRILIGTDEKNKVLIKKNEENKNRNIEISFLKDKSIALLKIHSFGDEFIEADVDSLKLFITHASSYKKVIIDIRGNGGGNSLYWYKNIVPFFISNYLVYKTTLAFKNTNYMRKFKPDYFLNSTKNKPELPNLPPELINSNILFNTTIDTLHPSQNTISYKGEIYLLVDNKVFSSAEAFAVFCKQTQFAKIVGETTAGDGIGTDPGIYTLPNSGLVIRFTAEMGLNNDGSANEETKTIPDIKTKSNSDSEIINLIHKLQYVSK